MYEALTVVWMWIKAEVSIYEYSLVYRYMSDYVKLSDHIAS